MKCAHAPAVTVRGGALVFTGFDCGRWRRPARPHAHQTRYTSTRQRALRQPKNFYRLISSEGTAHLGAPGRGDGALDGGAHLAIVPVLALPDGAVGVLDAVDTDALGEGAGRLVGEALG